jgi:hypothetical protein
MTVKMIASRTFYKLDERKEYAAGERFTVDTQDDADRLIRRRKAELAGKGRNITDSPRKTMTAKVAQTDAPLEQSGQSRSNTYQRRDMVAEQPKQDGQTGPDSQSQS